MRSLKKLGFSSYSITKSGEVYSHISERFLKQQNRGYVQIGLRNDSGNQINCYVHRLVAMTYCDGYDEKFHVNHIDGDKSNNNFWNLEWVTRSENMLHAWHTGLIKTNKADYELVHSVCKKLESGFKASDVATSLDIGIDLVQDILQGKSWNWISEEYDFTLVPKKGRLNPEKVLRICRLLENEIPMKEISEQLNTSYYNIKNIKQRRTFQNISRSFKW